jgi:hypothetical protein
MYAPLSEDRPFPADRNVLFVHGKVYFYNEALDVNQNPCRTELYKVDGKPARIVWQPKRISAIPYQNIKTLTDDGYKREGRLTLAYAMDVQQHVAANLTRVGLRVKPPLFTLLDVEVYGQSPSGSGAEMVGAKIVGGALLIEEIDKPKRFLLTLECVNEVAGRLADALKLAEAAVEALRAEQQKCRDAKGEILPEKKKDEKALSGKLVGANSKVEQLKTLLKASSALVQGATEMTQLPSNDAVTLGSLDARVFLEKTDFGEKYPGGAVVLNLRRQAAGGENT